MLQLKTGLFALAFALISILGSAQTGRGSLLFGGSLLYSQQDIEISVNTPGFRSISGSERTISMQPKAGYFIADDLAVGLFGSLSDDKLTYESYFATGPNSRENFERYMSTYVGGVFSRFYLPVKEGSSAIFLHGELGFGNANFKTTVQDSTLGPVRISEQPESFVTSFGIGLGLTLFASEKAGVELGILYRSTSSTYNSRTSALEVTELYSGFELQLGLSLYPSLEGTRRKTLPSSKRRPQFD